MRTLDLVTLTLLACPACALRSLRVTSIRATPPAARGAAEDISHDRVRLMTSAFLAEARHAGDHALAAHLSKAAARTERISPMTALVEALLLEEDLKRAQRTLDEQVATVGRREAARVVRQLQSDLAEEEAGSIMQLRLSDLLRVVESSAS
eukprot:1837817-Prymnesium_polylepis.1